MTMNVMDGPHDKIGQEARREDALHNRTRGERVHVSAPKRETTAQANARRQQLAIETGTRSSLWK